MNIFKQNNFEYFIKLWKTQQSNNAVERKNGNWFIWSAWKYWLRNKKCEEETGDAPKETMKDHPKAADTIQQMNFSRNYLQSTILN